MSFKLKKTETFKQQVTIETPDDKGRVLKETVVATFNRCDEDELQAMDQMRNPEVLRRVLRNVEGMLDEEGQAVPFEGDHVEALLAIPQATYALAAAFWSASRLGRAKN